MYSINKRPASEHEMKRLKFLQSGITQNYFFHYASMAAAALMFYRLAGIFILENSPLLNSLITILLAICVSYKIYSEKTVNAGRRSRLTEDIKTGEIEEIYLKDAFFARGINSAKAEIYCYELGDGNILFIKDILSRFYEYWPVFNNDENADPAEFHKMRPRLDAGNIPFPCTEFTLARAPKSGVILSIKPAGKKIENFYKIKMPIPADPWECEILPGSFRPIFEAIARDLQKKNEDFPHSSGNNNEIQQTTVIPDVPAFTDEQAQDGLKFYDILSRPIIENIKLNKNLLSFNETLGIIAGSAIFYILGRDIFYGAASGWAAGYIVTNLTILFFDGLSSLENFFEYASNVELYKIDLKNIEKNWKKFFFFTSTSAISIIVALAYSEPLLPYYYSVPVSLFLGAFLFFIPAVYPFISMKFSFLLLMSLALFLIGFHEAALQFFLVVSFFMLVIGVANKYWQFGMVLYNLLFTPIIKDPNALRTEKMVRNFKPDRPSSLAFKFLFSIVFAVFAVTLSIPDLPDVLYSLTHKIDIISGNSGQTQTASIESIGIKFVFIPPGKFTMGNQEKDGQADEKILHDVVISKGFYMAATETTQKQWQAVMGTRAGKFKGDLLPVENVTWIDCQKFVEKINRIEKGNFIYRLPTEAEWEYACRAGSKTKYCFGDDDGKLGEYAWFFGNSDNKTHPVGIKLPNKWGLYDMHGNVWEWCSTIYANYSPFNLIDPQGPAYQSYLDQERCHRGGGWYNPPDGLTSSNRNGLLPDKKHSDIGFRLVRIDK